jgi:hypothetical protein
MSIAPPRFRQKIKTRIGIALSAIKGPDIPIPMIPPSKSGMSRPVGIAV